MNDVNEYGNGIICPFQRDGKGDFVNGSGLRLLASDVKELIGIIGPTRTQPGELPWNTAIGSRVLAMKHRSSHAELVRATAQQLVSEPVRKYEKRVRPGPTTVQTDPNTTSMIIRFSYLPIGSVGTKRYETVDFVLPE